MFIERQNEKLAWSNEIGRLSDRELLIAGAVAYWAEGAKAKPWRPTEHVTFINSDVGMVKLFLAYLRLLHVHPQRLRLRIHIHESADVAAASRFWAESLDQRLAHFQPPTLKRHRVVTNRKNVGLDYNGCLSISVLQSAALYRRIEGTWWAVREAAMDSGANLLAEQHDAAVGPGSSVGLPPRLALFRSILRLGQRRGSR